MVEHEMMVRTANFGVVPSSALPQLHKDRAERMAKEREKAERLKNNLPFVLCPLSGASAMNNGCTREKCALFVDNACSLAKIAAGEPNETTGKHCPILRRACRADCALNVGGGCIITTFEKE